MGNSKFRTDVDSLRDIIHYASCDARIRKGRKGCGARSLTSIVTAVPLKKAGEVKSSLFV